MAEMLVLGGLEAREQLDGNPLLLALHKGCHDLVDAILVQSAWLHAVDVFLVILGRLLLAGLLGNRRIPAVAVVDAERFNRRKRQLRGALCLRLAANKTNTIWLAAVAGLRISAITVDVVVEDQLLAGPDGAGGENAHAQLVANHPFVHVAIGIARVVAKPAQVALFGCVDKLALGQRHKVEVLDALLVVLDHPIPKRGLVNHLAKVLEHKVIGLQVGIRSQAEALLLGLDDRDLAILFALEPLVLATFPAVAIAIDTLDFCRAVDAVRVLAACVVLVVVCRWQKKDMLGGGGSHQKQWGRREETYANLRHNHNPTRRGPRSPYSWSRRDNHRSPGTFGTHLRWHLGDGRTAAAGFWTSSARAFVIVSGRRRSRGLARCRQRTLRRWATCSRLARGL